MESDPRQAAAVYRQAQGWKILAEFADLLRLPNVTRQTDDLEVNAAELVRRFEDRGASMEIARLDGAAPVVIGELRTEAPTAVVGVYVHYDGQPVDPDEWTFPPFSVTLTTSAGQPVPYPGAGDPIDPEWRIHARGASDDKTPFAALTSALDALAEAGIARTVDLVFLFEGEEESGSPSLDRYLTELAPRLRADVWLLCDGPVHQSRAPQVAFGVRGYCGFDLTFYGPEHEVHSGHYGNWVPNPAFELAVFLAGCKDESGRVTIEGFYDDTAPITDEDRRAIEALPDVEASLMEEIGFAGPEVEGAGYAELLMIPSFNVRGLRAAGVGVEARNVVPSHATTSVDIRLAAGDDPEAMLSRVRAHIEKQGYHLVDDDPGPVDRRTHRRLARLVPTAGYRAARIPMDSPLARVLLDVCSRASHGDVVALPTFGGSIPLYLFEDILGAPVAILPIANHDNNQHAADENIRIANLWYGVDLWSVLLTTDFSSVRDDPVSG